MILTICMLVFRLFACRIACSVLTFNLLGFVGVWLTLDMFRLPVFWWVCNICARNCRFWMHFFKTKYYCLYVDYVPAWEVDIILHFFHFLDSFKINLVSARSLAFVVMTFCIKAALFISIFPMHNRLVFIQFHSNGMQK